MRLLVLGGSGFVGRAIVRAALEHDWEVTTFNRGRSAAEPGAREVRGDRQEPSDLDALAGERFDGVVDTWGGAPEVVDRSARVLAASTGRYCYLSSRAVYQPPTPVGMDESWTTVEASPTAGPQTYPLDKRGGEMATEQAFGDRALLARAGVILGPGDGSDRLTCWLRRAARGGDMAAPGPPELPVRYLDARDLAAWILGALEAELSGPVNLCNREGHTTMASFLEAVAKTAGGEASLVWLTPEQVTEAGIDRRAELPGWLPDEPELGGMVHTTVELAHATGLSCRPVTETVEDTWAWATSTRQFDTSGPLGLEPEREQLLLKLAGTA